MSARREAMRRILEQAPAHRAIAPGIRFSAVGGPLESRWRAAFDELAACVRPSPDGADVLHEGGVYHGTWLESTGTISAEILGRFAPGIALETVLQFARHQREDGLIPYKVIPDGPGWSQIQIVSPLARTVWHLFQLTGDRSFLETMYPVMARYDAWLARYRDTLGTGGVEAFCTFDTGHDGSPRFWFAPDRAFRGDARDVDPSAARVPYVAPDLTANVACQRRYLAIIAEELGADDAAGWRERASASTDALYAQCYDRDDHAFYDRDKHGELVRIPSDVIARVLACEIGDGEFFSAALERHLMNTRRFLAAYGFATIAMDDPRFDRDATRNSWAGPVNFLAQLRAPHAFEHHGRVAELAIASEPVLASLARTDVFPQCLDPFSGDAGYTSVYSPAILWFLDQIERTFGVLERPDDAVWVTGLAPTRLEHGRADATAYARQIDGLDWIVAADDHVAELRIAGREAAEFPRGWRIECTRSGEVTAVVCVAPAPVWGVLRTPVREMELSLAPNERIDVATGERTSPGFTPPQFSGEST